MNNTKTKPAPSPILDENIKILEKLFADCQDFIGRKFPPGGEGAPWIYTAYIDAMTDRELTDLTVIRRLFDMDWSKLSQDGKSMDLYTALRDRGIATADISEADNWDDILYFIHAGDTAVFVEGFNKVIVIATRGFPNRGIQATETEVVVQGPREAFSEVMRFNTALVRRRIRDTNLKVKQSKLGRRSLTDIALMYMEDIVRPEILQEVERRLEQIQIDGISDSGCVEQLIEENWLSPFPQVQLTERPDKAASSILEGRIAIIVDNSPFVILVPVTLNCLFQSAEDYYSRWQVMSITRFTRFIGAFLAVALPAFYIAVALYHPGMIPLLMVTKLAEASQAVPFPAVIEIFLLDAAFELLREASIRLRNASGGTIGIVGGLIVGQAAVEAGLVSPIVVIIVAMTSIATFAIPNISLVYSFRLVKYGLLLAAAAFGFLGLGMGLIFVLVHLASLKSFHFPYLMPFASAEMDGYHELKDSLFRFPLTSFTKRPFFARRGQRNRM
ncbi:MAG: spore germination protein [Firmicutes bacterium]|nr:spore germination protein [Bacillota bacterium]